MERKENNEAGREEEQTSFHDSQKEEDIVGSCYD